MATTKITKGASFKRAAEYDLTNSQKSKADREAILSLPATPNELVVPGFKAGERARLLTSNLIGETPQQLASEFERVAAQKPGIKEPAHKVAVSAKPGEHLETHQWIAIGMSYLKEMGYANSPYLIAQHREKDHEHIHILTSRVDFNGNVVSDFYEQKRAREWTMRIEEKFDLQRTPQKAPERGLSRVEIEQALKNKEPPPKLILQAAIKQTLAVHQESSEFVEALEKKSISVIVKTNQEKEILGISFGYAGKKFKGSSLGTNFSWKGLQENGLTYEPQRDYERLEAASRRTSEGKSNITGNQFAGSKTTGTDDYALESGPVQPARYGSDSSRREEDNGPRFSGLESGNQTQFDQPATASIANSAAESESVSETGNRAAQRGGQKELRRAWESDRGETETARTDEPAVTQAASAEEYLEAFKQQLIIDLSSNENWFEQQERERWARLYDRSAESYLLPAGAESTRISETESQAMDTAAGNTVLGGNDGIDSGIVRLGGMDNNRLLQNDLVVIQEPHHADDICSLAGLRSDLSDAHISDSSSNLYDDNERAAARSVSRSVNLSDGLKVKLDDAEYEVKKILTIQDDLERFAEEKKQIEVQAEEIELDRTKGLYR